MPRGKVYIASMNMRGIRAERPPNATYLNVTSAQQHNANRRDFSPMTPVEGTYKGFWNFESYWQSGKVFGGIDPNDVREYWLNLKEAKRRYPKSKDRRVLYCQWPHTEKLSYVESRKQVYLPEYYNLIKDREQTKFWRQYVKDGNDVVIYDFDGPRDENKNPLCLEFTKELFLEKLQDENFSFGHGYIVALLLCRLKLC